MLDKHSTIPLFLQLKHHIIHLISSGEWTAGMPLPSVRQVASELGMATATVQRTYGELQAQGLLVGHVGRGVYVADLAIGVPGLDGASRGVLAAERGSVLRGLLARSVLLARGMGYREDEIMTTVRALTTRPNGVTQLQPRIVFVGSQGDVVEKYQHLLHDALRGLGVVVDTLLMSDLEVQGDTVLDEREPIRCLVSLVGSFSQLRSIAGHRATPLFGLVVDLSEETQRRLVDLPHDVRIGLVAEERYMPSARAVLRQYLGVEDRVDCATDTMRSKLRRIVRDRPIVIHTLGVKRIVERLASQHSELVELQFQPNPSSVARLRSLLTADAEEASPADGLPGTGSEGDNHSTAA